MSIARNSSSLTAAEEHLFLDILNDAPLAAHRKPTKIYGSIVYCFLLAGYAIVGVGAPWIFQPLEAWISPLLCSGNVILLLITGIFQQYLVYQVQKIRLQGYYKLSQRLKHIVRLPFSTISYGTAGMLLLVVWEPKISFLSSSATLRYLLLFNFMLIFLDFKLYTFQFFPQVPPKKGTCLELQRSVANCDVWSIYIGKFVVSLFVLTFRLVFLLIRVAAKLIKWQKMPIGNVVDVEMQSGIRNCESVDYILWLQI